MNTVTAIPDFPKIKSPKWERAIFIEASSPFSFLFSIMSLPARWRAWITLRKGEAIITSRYLSFISAASRIVFDLRQINFPKEAIWRPVCTAMLTKIRQMYLPKFERNCNISEVSLLPFLLFSFFSFFRAETPPFRDFRLVTYLL